MKNMYLYNIVSIFTSNIVSLSVNIGGLL